MLKTDATILANQLNALAEVYGKAAVTAKALEVWFDALKEFPTERVMGILLGWPKMHQRFPSPSEVWKICNEEGTVQREEKAARERAENTSRRMPHMATERGRQIIAGIREMLKRPRMSPIEHWHCVLAGDYPERSKIMAREALAILQRGEKEADQDEERLAA